MFSDSVKTTVTLVLIIAFSSNVYSQNNQATNVENVSSEVRAGFLPPGYEEVTTKFPDSFGSIEKCGEGASKGVDLCVPYFKCDRETRTILPDGRTDGFGIIDIRFGDDKPCDHYLDVCCKIGNETSSFSSSTEEAELPPPEPTESKPSSERPITEPTSKPINPAWTCGIRNDNGIDFKITGNNNHEAEYGEFPWMVAVVKSNDNSLVCGASLISDRVVLTAAHCVEKFQTHNLKVRVGEWDTQTEKERLPYQERNIRQIVMHEKFDRHVLFNDVALLVLDMPVVEAENVGTICLPPKGQNFDFSNCVATGWGKDKFGMEGVYQALLKKIDLPVVPHNECQERLRATRLGKYFVLDKSFLCAGGQKGLDTCEGDGGSPLVCPDPNQSKRYVQAGIVAWGIGCGDEIPAVYADVAKLVDWIHDKMSFI